MLRRLGVISSAYAIAIIMSMLLVLRFDFISEVTIFDGVADMLSEMSMLQYVISSAFAFVIIVLPVDYYFYSWGLGGFSLNSFRNVDVTVSIQLLIFFGVIGLFIGGMGTKVGMSKDEEGGIADAILNSFLFVGVCNIILIVIIWLVGLLSPIFSSLVTGIVEGISGRDFWLFVVCGTLENGTIIAVFAAFTASLMSDNTEGVMHTEICKGSDICEI